MIIIVVLRNTELLHTNIQLLSTTYPQVGREPPDAMSLCYADIEPPRFVRQTEPPLGRQSHR